MEVRCGFTSCTRRHDIPRQQEADFLPPAMRAAPNGAFWLGRCSHCSQVRISAQKKRTLTNTFPDRCSFSASHENWKHFPCSSLLFFRSLLFPLPVYLFTSALSLRGFFPLAAVPAFQSARVISDGAVTIALGR